MENEEKIVVTYVYKLPDHEHELNLVRNAAINAAALSDIYNLCRNKWKYDEKATAEEIFFAEEIARMIPLEEI